MTTHFSKKILNGIIGIFTLIALSAGSAVYAVTPTVSATVTGNGDSVLLSVTGDANSGVLLNYLGTSSVVQLSALGTTNSSGIFSATLSTATYGIARGSLFNISVNNQRSDSLVWPYLSSTTTSPTISLNQSSLTILIGQTSVISANNTTGNSLYLASNTNPSIANISINNNQITVLGNTAGSTSFQICSTVNTTNCATVVVTVQSTNVQTIGFSQNNLTVGLGQTVPVTVTGGTGTYVISGNSNPSALQATVNGTTVNLYGANSSGSASITVCSSNLSSCGVIIASAGASSSNSSALSFSQTNPVLSPGQVLAVTISGGSGSYYISSNANSGVIQANLVGATLTLYGNSAGSSVLSICATGGGCSTLAAMVAAPGTIPLTLSQNNISLSPGQTSNITLSGAGGYAVTNNSNSSVATGAITGSTLLVTAVATGSTSITVCQTGGGCALASVSVNGTTLTPTVSAPLVTLLLTVGQDLRLAISGGSDTYTLSSNPSTPFSASLSTANVLTLHGTAPGNASVNVCNTNGGCVAVAATVANAPVVIPTVPPVPPTTPTKLKYKFAKTILPGSKGAEVSELQKRLKEEKLLSGDVTGFYGAATLAAVKKYQTLHGLEALGIVGPGTRGELNAE